MLTAGCSGAGGCPQSWRLGSSWTANEEGGHFQWRARDVERLRVAVLCGLCRICKWFREDGELAVPGGAGEEREEGAGLRLKAEELGLCPEGETKAAFQARDLSALWGIPLDWSLGNGVLGSSAGSPGGCGGDPGWRGGQGRQLGGGTLRRQHLQAWELAKLCGGPWASGWVSGEVVAPSLNWKKHRALALKILTWR